MANVLVFTVFKILLVYLCHFVMVMGKIFPYKQNSTKLNVSNILIVLSTIYGLRQ